MYWTLRNSLLKQPGDEDPDEGVRDLVELVLKKMDVDKDGKVSMQDYRWGCLQILINQINFCVLSIFQWGVL